MKTWAVYEDLVIVGLIDDSFAIKWLNKLHFEFQCGHFFNEDGTKIKDGTDYDYYD